jgi:hypothetical protein
MNNRVFCRTHDEVNAHLAQRWCDQHGLEFQLADQRDRLFPSDAAAIVLDLNHLGLRADERQAIVSRICKRALHCPVAVACYDFEPAAIARLKTRGVLVARCLKRWLFRSLAKVIHRDSREKSAARRPTGTARGLLAFRNH